MSSIKMKGRNVEEATKSALEVLGTTIDEVDVKVINKGKEGMLGVFGGEEAEVEVCLKKSSAEQARKLLQDILDRTGFVSLVDFIKEEDDRVYLEIKGDDLGRIIGREGASLDALQIIVSSILSKQAQKRKSVTIDAADYRKRRGEKLGKMAIEAIEKALENKDEVVLEPMNAQDRREVHLAVKDDGRASSFSKGEGPSRRVVISPAGAGNNAQEDA